MAQVAEKFVVMPAPSVPVEAPPAVIVHAVRMHDAPPGGEQALDDVRRVLDHVDVQP